MVSVGVRELKARLSRYVRQAAKGERIVVTDRGRPVAMIGPVPLTPEDEGLEEMVRRGLARWAGGVPRGAAQPARVLRGTVAGAVIEGRR